MDTSGNTVLITGGATGIGFAMAQALVGAGNEVLICGRRGDRLAEAQRTLRTLSVQVCDVADAQSRGHLAAWAEERGVNVLVNNAGMQRMVDFRLGLAALENGDNEIRCNLEGPVYLTARLVPHLMARPGAAIVNVSSGLGFVPIAAMPVYCAAKAALHSFSVSLRHQLASTGVRVFEVIPPTVDTELDRGARERRGQVFRGIRPDEVAEAFLAGWAEDRFEVAVGRAAGLMAGAREDFDAAFAPMNGRA